jgi:hypothetical protein
MIESSICTCEDAGRALRISGVELISARGHDERVVLDYGFKDTGVVVLRSVHSNVRSDHSHVHRLMGLPLANVVQLGART